MKKIFLSALTVFFALSLLTTSVSAQSVGGLSEDQIQQKLLDIADKYDINEQLSQEDAAFVKRYAEPVQSGEITTSGLKRRNVSGSKSNSKISAKIRGSIFSDIGVINNSFGGSVTATVTKGKPKSIDTQIRHVAFGLVGSGGVGKVQDKTLHSKCNGTKSCTNSQSHRYVASVAYATTYAEAVIKYSGGTLKVEATKYY